MTQKLSVQDWMLIYKNHRRSGSNHDEAIMVVPKELRFQVEKIIEDDSSFVWDMLNLITWALLGFAAGVVVLIGFIYLFEWIS